MRLLCTADLHIGSGVDLYEPGSTRLAKQAELWSWIVAEAVRGRADAIIVAGDVFHRRSPSPEEHWAFRGGLQDARDARIPVWTIVGNHDMTTVSAPDAISLHGTEHVRRAEMWTIEGPEESARVAFLPWCPPGRFYAEALEGDRDDANERLARALEAAARGLHAEGAEILVGHWSLSGSTTPTGADVSSFREPVINSAALADIGFSVCVFGHIHKRQWIGAEASHPVMFLGSPWCIDWGEWDSPHCVTWLYRDQKGFWAVEPVDVPDTRFVTLDAHEPIADRGAYVGGAVVRVRWRGTRDEYSAWDDAAYTQQLLDDGALRVASVQVDLVSEARARVEGLTESAEPADALDAYITARGTPEDLAARARVAHTEIVEEL